MISIRQHSFNWFHFSMFSEDIQPSELNELVSKPGDETHLT